MVFRSLILLLFFFTSSIYSQIKINGKVIDENNIPLQSASVVVTNIRENVILAYAISDNNGMYSLEVNSKSDSLQIKASYIGFSKQSKTITNKNQAFDFILLESSEKLKEVIIKNIPITKKGDTINYSVGAFKDQKDRVIADVLKKLPGIEVLTDGKILYQGKPIQKYYIEGLDLLEGKYNLANNNLPANSVSKVQVLENHQPIKLLDSLVFSDKASLNIKLKKNIVVTGTSKLGVGLTPFLWDVNITPMLFSKKQQMITSYQSNNIGNDISNEIKSLTIEELLEQTENSKEKLDWVTIQELPTPTFHKKRWLNNNAHLLSSNYLIRLKKDLDFKVNVSYINDYQKQNGETAITFFTPTTTINTIEDTKNRLFSNSLKTKFILTKNTAKNYFKNTFEIDKDWDFQKGIVNLNTQEFKQKAKIPFLSLNNRLKIIKPFGKKLITFKSILNYSKSPQNLSVNFNKSQDLLNNGYVFNKLDQEIEHSNFYTNNSFSFTKSIKKLTLVPMIGFSIKNQKLNSLVSLFDNNNKNILQSNFQNNLSFNNSSLYFNLNTQYRIRKWRIELEALFKNQTFDRIDVFLNKNQNLSKLIFEPQLTIKKDLNDFWKTSLSVNSKNSFGDINQLYYGYIFNNYRNIQKYETPILEGLNRNFSFGFSYRNPIKSLFFNSFYSYSLSSQNLVFGSNINTNGATSFGFFEQNNNNNTHNINLRGSKYFSKIKTTLTLITDTSLNKKEQLLNNTLVDITTKKIKLKGKIDTEITEWLSLQYQNTFSISNIEFQNQEPFETIINQKHLLNFNFYPSSNQYIGFDTEFYKNNFSNQNQENYFLNLNYTYTFIKSKIDLELNWNNILNTKRFTSVFNDTFSYTQSVFELRPRQLLISLKFNF